MRDDTDTSSLLNGLFAGIVNRLRAVLLVITTVIVATCLAALLLAGRIEQAQTDLAYKAVPLLTLTRQAESDLHRLMQTFERATFAENKRDLEDVTRELMTDLGRFEQTTGALRLSAGSAHTQDPLEAALNRIRGDTDDLRELQNLAFSNMRDLILMRQELATQEVQAHDALKRLTFENSIKIENVQSQMRDDQKEPPDIIEPVASDLFLASQNLTGLSIDIGALADQAAILALLSGDTDSFGQDRSFPETREKMSQLFQRIATRLDKVSPGNERSELLSISQMLKALSMGPGGILELGQKQLLLQNRLSTLRADRLRTIADVSGQLDLLTQTARDEADKSTGALKQATRQLTTGTLIMSVLAVLVAIFANVSIVEKQVKKRISQLGDAAQSIADGDLEYPVVVEGKDEISGIAGALEIFKQKARELRRSNVDLESFAYVAAHDLRSPLRAIHDLTQWTLEDESNVLSDESGEYLAMLQQRADRLSRLLTDLLDYARAGHAGSAVRPVDFQKLVEQVTSMLDPDGCFEVVCHGPDEPVLTHAVPLEQILLNLISNAIKHHDYGNGRIDIRVTASTGRVQFEIEDDGPGIPEIYQEQVFNLFQTLRPRDEVEGSGMGLAIIRKLLERYNGTVTVRSDPRKDRGAVFCFDLPAGEEIAGKPKTLNLKAA